MRSCWPRVRQGLWAFQPSPVVDLQAMPLHATVDADGDPRSVTAEAWLVRERITWLTSVGLMPLLCVKGRDAVQLSLIESLAVQEGAAKSPLLGRWGQKDVVRLPRTGMTLPVSASVSLVSGSTLVRRASLARRPLFPYSAGLGEAEVKIPPSRARIPAPTTPLLAATISASTFL